MFTFADYDPKWPAQQSLDQSGFLLVDGGGLLVLFDVRPPEFGAFTARGERLVPDVVPCDADIT